jgi:hypothetical protein
LIKLPFIETVSHILNRNLPLVKEVWPPGSHDINPFYLKCGILGEVLTDPLTQKNQFLITTIMDVFSNIPREVLKRACSPFRPNVNKQFLKVSSSYCYFLIFYEGLYLFKKGVSTPLAPCM